jgi:hypothetical protein
MTMPAKSSPKREHEFKQLEQRFQKEHRYPGREEEVAARIVNKQRAQYGETKGERQKDKEGKSPDQGLPLQGYQHLTIAQIAGQLGDLSAADIRKIRTYETKHKNRKGVLDKLDRRLSHH